MILTPDKVDGFPFVHDSERVTAIDELRKQNPKFSIDQENIKDAAHSIPK